MKVTIHDLKRLRLPDLGDSFFHGIGVENLADLRRALKELYTRKIESEQRQAMHHQVVDQLIMSTPFELPADLVTREERSTLQRLFYQLKQQGKTDKEIRAREASLRANAHESTLRSLKELLAPGPNRRRREDRSQRRRRLARNREHCKRRTDESVRRVRARFEKEGGTDSLAAQDLGARKVIDRISSKRP